MSKYAATTSVSVGRSKAEIEDLVTRYGATQFHSGWTQEKSVIGFAMNDRHIKFFLPLPAQDDPRFHVDARGRDKSKDRALAAWDQDVRQRWRALVLVIKAKLEAVESGITTFEDEFLAHIVLPNGETVGSLVKPQLINAYNTKKMPLLLGAGN